MSTRLYTVCSAGRCLAQELHDRMAVNPYNASLVVLGTLTNYRRNQRIRNPIPHTFQWAVHLLALSIGGVRNEGGNAMHLQCTVYFTWVNCANATENKTG